jgi:hypothetical protein
MYAHIEAYNKLGFSIWHVNGEDHIQRIDDVEEFSFDNYGDVLPFCQLDNDEQAYEIAHKCGFTLNKKGKILGFKQRYHYNEHSDEVEFFEDLLKETGGNTWLAWSIFDYCRSSDYYYSMFTFLQEMVDNGEIIELMGVLYQMDTDTNCIHAKDAVLFLHNARNLWRIQQREDENLPIGLDKPLPNTKGFFRDGEGYTLFIIEDGKIEVNYNLSFDDVLKQVDNA